MKRIFLFIFILISASVFAQPNYTLDSIVVVTSNDTVYVWDYNTWEQCAFLLDYTVEVIDSIITITQIDTAEEMTTCYGYHNFVVPVVGLTEGNYRIDIFRDCLFEDIKFIKSFWYEYSLNGIDDFGDQPNQITLYNAYPNPFNPSTTISFVLPSKSFISLKVFDALGREVANILTEEISAGNFTRQWNANGLPSGIYFYRLQAGSYTESKKLVLLR